MDLHVNGDSQNYTARVSQSKIEIQIGNLTSQPTSMYQVDQIPLISTYIFILFLYSFQCIPSCIWDCSNLVLSSQQLQVNRIQLDFGVIINIVSGSCHVTLLLHIPKMECIVLIDSTVWMCNIYKNKQSMDQHKDIFD